MLPNDNPGKEPEDPFGPQPMEPLEESRDAPWQLAVFLTDGNDGLKLVATSRMKGVQHRFLEVSMKDKSSPTPSFTPRDDAHHLHDFDAAPVRKYHPQQRFVTRDAEVVEHRPDGCSIRTSGVWEDPRDSG